MDDNGRVNFTLGEHTFSFSGPHADAMRNYDPCRDPAPAPEWLYRMAAQLGGIGGDGASATDTLVAEPLAEGEVIEEGRRDTILTSLAGTMRRRGFSEAAIRAALSVENETRCEPPLSEEQVRKIAHSVARYEPDAMSGVTLRLSGNTTGKVVRVPASQLRRLAAAEKWLWKGLLPAEMVTIFSALPKAGKTTLLTHLLRAVESEGQFCGQPVRASRVVYVTEESETIWAERRDKLGLKDHCEFVLRPFRSKPSAADWTCFLADLTASLTERPAELVVIDTLAKLWPVKNENDASEVTEALMPLLEIAYGLHSTLALVHHLRKTDGLESTATRGSGGITAAVDCILELRRYKPGDRNDRRRVLHCDSRFDDRLDEVVVALADDGSAYAAHGDRCEAACADCARIIMDVLSASEAPHAPPGMTWQQIAATGWEEGPTPTKKVILDALRYGNESGWWQREGDGVKGSPFTFWKP